MSTLEEHATETAEQAAFRAEARAFLDIWSGSQPEATLAQHMWSNFGCDGSAPLDALRDVRVWRLALESEAVHIFERIYRHRVKTKLSRADLLQVVYLGLADHALLITRDRRLVECGNRILLGRYGMREVVYLDDWLS